MTIEISPLVPGIVAETAAARISIAPMRGRLSVRTRGNVAALATALGLNLPDRIGERTSAGAIEAIRLGPDEWTVLAPLDNITDLAASCARLAADHPHSLVDISGREVTLLIEGPKAAELLTLGCPRDIETILPGQGRRTLFDGATVVLWRDDKDHFRVDVWNSFASHVAQLLETGSRELAAESA